MIEFLSNPSWINPQIDFLLFLQNIRMNTPDIFDKFFLSITVFGEFWIPTLLCAIVYWCIDFKAGLYLFSLEGINSILAHFFKLIACVYRPWILSDKIHPSELAIPFAKGYSFPSGHSAMSSSVWGGLAYLLRQKKILCILLICLILLIGFSRLWLGVHTPQDVLCGFLTGLCLIFIVHKIINWAEKKPNRYIFLLIITDIISVLTIIYVCYFNTYRMDYISGELLVNPAKSIYSTIKLYAYMLGLLNGCYLCARFFPYNPKEFSVKTRLIIGIIGAILVITLLKGVGYLFVTSELPLRILSPVMFVTGVFITFIYPIIFQFFIRKTKTE